ncbi:MAG: NAD-dependent epimerase/dehydratase family protein [Alphaproteobacteria bacterium]
MSLPSNWLVTGGCGFIGARLTARLVERGANVRVVDNLSVGSPSALPRGVPVTRRPWPMLDAAWPRLELVEADIRDADAMIAAAAGAQAIVHLAASTGVLPSIAAPRPDCENNVLGTLNCLEGARANGVSRFVFASSGAPLGEQEPPLHERKVPKPISPYGASKLAGEGYCSAYWGSFGIETVVLRFGNVYGPGSAHKQSVVAKFLRRAIAGEPLEVFGEGTQTRDFIYIDDIVDAIERAATTAGIGGEVYQIATQRERTVNEIADMIAAAVRERLGREVAVRHVAPQKGEVQRNFSDTSKAQSELGFCARHEIRSGIAQTLDYLLEEGAAA